MKVIDIAKTIRTTNVVYINDDNRKWFISIEEMNGAFRVEESLNSKLFAAQNHEYKQKVIEMAFNAIKTTNRKIVTLVGSTKFKKEYEEAAAKEGRVGNIVLSCVQFSHADNLIITEEEKEEFDRLHKDKISMSDEVFVINPNGYIGESTKSEINHAKSLNKLIRYLELDIMPTSS